MYRVRRGFKVEVTKDLLTVNTCHTDGMVQLRICGPEGDDGKPQMVLVWLRADQAAKLRAALGLVLEERKDD